LEIGSTSCLSVDALVAETLGDDLDDLRLAEGAYSRLELLMNRSLVVE
jgi:hypothetical protein